MYRLNVLLLLLTLAAGLAHGQERQLTLQEVDRLRMNGQIPEAAQALEKICEGDPQNADAFWRLSRSYVDIGQHVRGREEQLAWFQKGVDAAQKGIAADPKSSNSHVAYAIAAGRMALVSPTKKKVELSRVVKEHADKAIAVDPQNALAYHVRARWNYGLSDLGMFEKAALRMVYGGVPHASFEAAARDYEQAIRLENRAVHHLELGKTYAKLGQHEKARHSFQRALDAPKLDVADPEHKKDAAARLAKLN